MIIIAGGTPDDWGIIPSFLNEDDPRGAREQFNEHYHSGWHPFPGFTLDKDGLVLHYPGDPPVHAISVMRFRNELIVLFQFEWVMVFQPDETWEVCRMD